MSGADLLKGKRFIYTGSKGNFDELREMLRNEGGELLDFPTIEVGIRELDTEEIKVLRSGGRFGWILFTSSNAVKFFFEHLGNEVGECKLSDSVKFAVIGAKTGETLAQYGYKYNYINKGRTGTDFAHELGELIAVDETALYPTGTLTPDTFKNILGRRITRINVYQTTLPERIDSTILSQIITGGYDMLIFTSPSAFNNLDILVRGQMDLKKLRAVCIGQTTRQALLLKGLEPLAVAPEASPRGIADIIIEYYETIK